MSVAKAVFLILSAVTLGSALAVVTQRNLFHAALFLILSFFGVAGLYVLLDAAFLAGIQVLIYIGAIAILIIFAVMLTRQVMRPVEPQVNLQWAWAAGFSFVFLALVVWVTLRIPWPEQVSIPVTAESITRLGQALVDPQQYVLPFEVASVLLLVALIGSVAIARERD